jgi:hypothetical protein
MMVSDPFRQISISLPGKDGLPPTIGSRGNIWNPPPERISRRMTESLTALGKVLESRGFKGIFGADFQVSEDGDTVQLIEINPRPVASLPALTPLEITAGNVPLLAGHIAAFLKEDISAHPGQINLDGGQLIFRDALQIPDNSVVSGRYIYRHPDILEPQGSGWSPANLKNNECLIWNPECPDDTGLEKRRIFFSSAACLQRYASMLFGEDWIDSGSNPF